MSWQVLSCFFSTSSMHIILQTSASCRFLQLIKIIISKLKCKRLCVWKWMLIKYEPLLLLATHSRPLWHANPAQCFHICFETDQRLQLLSADPGCYPWWKVFVRKMLDAIKHATKMEGLMIIMTGAVWNGI